jgi:predicted AlkP superfamily phosphohydrolase/phosphomutase
VGLQLFKRTVRRRAKLVTLLPKAVRNKVRQVSFNVTAIDWAATKAYRFPMSPPAEGLVINVSGRQAQGIVAPGDEYERLRESLMNQVIRLEDPEMGQPMVERVYKREELYNGEFMYRAPDLVILFRDGYMGGKGLQAPLLTPHPIGKLSGHHSSEGIFLARGPEIKKNHRIDGAHILDLAPTILYALDVPIPRDMDGKVLQDIFRESFLQDRPITFSEPLGTSREREKELTAEEEENIREKLRGLGYLE